MSTADSLLEIYNLLFERFGPQHWWPGETRCEIIVGAILTQNTNWGNVEKAINNLKKADSLEPLKMFEMKIEVLAELIRPAGYYNIKAKRLKNFLKWLFENYDGRLENLESLRTEQLREELLSVSGIGKETADSILLYAFDREIFVVDAYTARVMIRHGLVEAGADYEQLRDLFERNLDSNAQTFNEYHALIVRLGKDYCKTKAKCPGCPLEKLPHETEVEYL